MTTPTDHERRAEALEAALKDIKFGADMMLQVPVPGAFGSYVREVRRVATLALETS